MRKLLVLGLVVVFLLATCAPAFAAVSGVLGECREVQCLHINIEVDVDINHALWVEVDPLSLDLGDVDPLNNPTGSDFVTMTVKSNDEWIKKIGWTNLVGTDDTITTYTILHNDPAIEVDVDGVVLTPALLPVTPSAPGPDAVVYYGGGGPTAEEVEVITYTLTVDWLHHAGVYTGTLVVGADQLP